MTERSGLHTLGFIGRSGRCARGVTGKRVMMGLLNECDDVGCAAEGHFVGLADRVIAQEAKRVEAASKNVQPPIQSGPIVDRS